MPKGIKMLVGAAAKQIDEDTIDETLDSILDFLSNAFVEIEKIRGVDIIPRMGTPENLTFISE
jgi:hypothetical protein